VAALLDASFIVAAADTSDLNHASAVRWLAGIDEPLLVGALSLADADAVLQWGLGPDAILALLAAVADGALRVVSPSAEDLARAATLIRDATVHRPRLVDALLVASAERLGVARIATFERRPLAVLRPTGQAFSLEP
jgi:predicted nucleic acid-binding protein